MMLSETLTRGTGCLNRARPGLWGLRAGNCPVLPGGSLPERLGHKNRVVKILIKFILCY